MPSWPADKHRRKRLRQTVVHEQRPFRHSSEHQSSSLMADCSVALSRNVDIRLDDRNNTINRYTRHTGHCRVDWIRPKTKALPGAKRSQSKNECHWSTHSLLTRVNEQKCYHILVCLAYQLSNPTTSMINTPQIYQLRIDKGQQKSKTMIGRYTTLKKNTHPCHRDTTEKAFTPPPLCMHLCSHPVSAVLRAPYVFKLAVASFSANDVEGVLKA